jgi:hypothetical protein
MSLYSRVILPRLIDLVMGNKAATAERAKLVPVALRRRLRGRRRFGT